MVADLAIGRQLRARRTAAGRTMASVAADAGLSVPYIANLENGRGNPTTAALTRLAGALGLRLEVTLVPAEPTGPAGPGEWGRPGPGGPAAADAQVPASLVRLGRTPRFRAAVAAMAAGPGRDADELAAELVPALALAGQALGRDLAEADWWRLTDALLLIAAHPA
jgi:transcriptional regulator with XRE-family HTH domain